MSTNRNDDEILSLLWETIPKLKDEIDSLKKCQIDFLRYAILLFGLTASVAAGLSTHLQLRSLDENPFHIFIYIILISIIPIVMPYIAWIIIHKCRSIFRIIAYIRVVENMKAGIHDFIKSGFIGYETAFRKVREHPWLQSRIFQFPSSIKNNFHGYKWWTNEAKKVSKDTINDNSLISVDGLDSLHKSKELYLGDYYGKQIFLIMVFNFIGIFCVGAFVYKGLCFQQISLRVFFGIIGIILVIWSFYHYRLIKRYLQELRYRPFSHDAFCDMWIWSFEQIINERSELMIKNINDINKNTENILLDTYE